MNFEQRLDELVGVEGGYVNDPADSGGETIWGITAAVARAFGYTGAMRDMTKAQAKEIYRARYWTQPRFDQVARLSAPIAYELFDTGFNMGQPVAGKFLQRALNVLNNGATAFPDLTVDGAIGKMTLYAMEVYLKAWHNRRKDAAENAQCPAVGTLPRIGRKPAERRTIHVRMANQPCGDITMDPILIGLAQFVPAIIKWATGSDKAEDVAGKVIDVAKAVTGRDMPDAALAAIQADPALAIEFRKAVTANELEYDRMYLADVQSARQRDMRNYRANVLAGMAILLVIVCLIVVVWMSDLNEYAKGFLMRALADTAWHGEKVIVWTD